VTPDDLLPIYPGDESEQGVEIIRDEFINKWSSFIVRKPFIILVGSLANWESSSGDIDILVKAHDPTSLLDSLDSAIIKLFGAKEDQIANLLISVQKFISADSLFLNAEWRILRAFPDLADRMHILDDSFSGPFTSFVELSDLVALSVENKKREQMDSNNITLSAARKVELFHPIPLLKPIHGRTKGEIYSVDSVIETIKSRKKDWYKANIAVQNKFDGVHCQADKKGSVVRVWTEDGTEITKNCPSIVKALAFSSFDFKVIGEMELWKEGKHQNRAITAGVLNTKVADPDESSLIFNLFDCLFHNSSDIHLLGYFERLRQLKNLNLVKSIIKLAETKIVKTEKALRDAITYFSKQDGSEGAYLKKLDFPYLLSGKTLENIKFKNELAVDVQIVKINVVGEKEEE